MKKNYALSFSICLFVTLSGVKGFAQQNIAPQNLFVLTPQERVLFTPPYLSTYTWGNNYEDYPLKNLWTAFLNDTLPVPLSATGASGWYDPNGTGSQNHSLLWIGESVIAYALQGNAAQYEIAAKNAITLLDSLDYVQGHMRHEGIGGYISFWQGGIAAMALGGLYAPAGSTSGPALLKSARRWWNDHIAVLRELRMPDGQLGLVGARMNHGYAGDDDEENIRAGINLQLIDPQRHNTLHPYLAALIDADGKPKHGLGGTYAVHWDSPRHVAERWVVLRAMQSGALLRVPANHATPFINRSVNRWTAGGRTHIATPAAVGLPRCRFWVSWQAGQWVRIENADSAGTTGGKGLPNGHLPQVPFTIPSNAVKVLGPVYSTPDPACAATSSCGNDLAVVSIAKPYHHGCMKNIVPQVVVKNEGTATISELAVYYQIDNNTLYSEYAKGAIKSKRFTIAGGLAPDATTTLTLDASTVTAGTHTLKVWVMDVNKITDMNATNDLQSIQFNVVNTGKPTTYSENFESITPGNIPADWTLYNPDATGNWFVHAAATNKAAALNNYGYTGANNAKDDLVMPVVDLTGNTALWLSFDLCHASKPAPTTYDSLQVMISTDCGQTFTSIWGKGGTALNTVADNANLFIPAGPQDYQNVKVDVSTYTSNSKAIFKFVNWSNNGNSTLIDNVNFTTSAVTGTEEFLISGSALQVYPNPASESIQITAELNSSTELKIKLVNSLGQAVNEVNYGVQSGYHVSSMDVKNYPAGIYNLLMFLSHAHGAGDGQVMTKKIVVLK